MAGAVFERHEMKFLLNMQQRCFLERAIQGRMRPDEHGESTICNVYFDTPDYLLIRRSIERPAYKEKLRLRTYGAPGSDSMAYAEIKKKAGGVVYKRRTGLPLREAVKDIAGGQLPAELGFIGTEIGCFIGRYGGLQPAALILYERTPWEKPEDGLRITFDRNVRFRDWNFDMTRQPVGIPLLGEGRIVMEVKVPDAYPLWMTHLFWSLDIRQQHFSKYGTAYAAHIAPAAGRPASISQKEALHSA